MKRDKIIYWFSTGIVAAGALIAGVLYISSPMMKARFNYLGFPAFFRIELGIAKVLGAIVLILPLFANRLKEWSYAGFAIVFVSATIAHIAVGELSEAVSPIFQLLVLVLSYVYFSKIYRKNRLT